jgi:hypothetical protein
MVDEKMDSYGEFWEEKERKKSVKRILGKR